MTIATQLSFDRLEQLWAQCKSWPGPISAVAYIALDEEAGRLQRERKMQLGGKMRLSSESKLIPGGLGWHNGTDPLIKTEGDSEFAAPVTLSQAMETVIQFHAAAESDLPCQVGGGLL